MKFTSLVMILFAASYASAHGTLRRISIQGQDFEGNAPGGPTNPSVIRQASTQDPNKGANNPALTCGPNSDPAALVADANPGDTITFAWRTADDGKWPHNIGPMLTYMASCGSVTCDKFDQSDAQWFKIDQVGRKPNSPDWVQNDLFQGGVASVQIPQNMAPGNYLIRHEIIALHLATAFGGAEFYPGCLQLSIGGNGNGVPSPSDLVKLPGSYSDNDPGIFDPNVFDPSAPYTFPGPKVATLVPSQGSPDDSSSSSPSPSSPASSTPGAPQPSSTPARKPCARKKHRASASASSSAANPTLTLVAAIGGDAGSNSTLTPTPTPTPGTDYRRRHLGRIMRRKALFL